MKLCDTCGADMNDKYPFVVCPDCLLAPSLSAREAPADEHPGPGNNLRLSSVFPRGDFFGKYDIVERVGEGGQGEVWKTWDYELRRHVAMKRLAKADLNSEPALYRFLAEAQITSQLEHPGILPIFDVGLDPDDRPYYTTSLLNGLTLQHVWQKANGPSWHEWPLNRTVDLLERVCDILAFAHSRGVIHRDLKPQNILVGSFGDVRVVDWGAAYIMAQDRPKFEEALGLLNREDIQTARVQEIWANPLSPLATQNTGQPLTIIFAPPEILAGRRHELGPTTDVYAVGVMLYELLTGDLPYLGPAGKLPEADALREIIKHGPPLPIRSLRPEASRDLASVCEKAMAHARVARYQSMSELSEELRAWLEVRPVKARRPGALLKLQKWTLRNVSLVLALSAAAVIASVAFFLSRAFKADRDAALQTTAVRSAELAARGGRWRQALQFWNQAEAAGYKDSVYLGLSRAEVWAVLDEPKRSRAELAMLMRRSDLGGEHGRVLLRMGEHELFDQATSEHGVHHVVQAIAAGLAGDDEAFAKGLLAQSSVDALKQFQQALVLNPYHHGAHVAVLGLEFLLGEHQQLQEEGRIFATLFPEDSSPVILEAMELASQNRLKDARARLGTVASDVNREAFNRLDLICRKLAVAAAYYDVNTFLGSVQTNSNVFMIETTPFELAGDFFASADPGVPIRIPQLACVKEGMLESLTGVRSLMNPFMTDPKAAVQKVKSGWRHHPEALMPLLAGLSLDRYRAADRSHSTSLISLQADLFQTAADSSSILPNLPRLARYLAAKTQFELAQTRQTGFEAAVQACLQNAARVCDSGECSTKELAVYYDFAFALKDYELARALIAKWEGQEPDNRIVLQKRIELELAVGALGAARDHLDQILARSPGDLWAMTQKKILVGKIRAMAESLQNP
jgi:serine/threonine protein kinase